MIIRGEERSRHGADVAIVGCGIVGSVVARALLEQGAHVLAIDAGTPMTGAPGAHLRNVPACRADRSFLSDVLRAQLRPASVPMPAGGGGLLGPRVPRMPAGGGLNALQRAAANMPGARVTSLFGGMGALWNCVALRHDAALERWPAVAPSSPDWDGLYARAEAMLGVGLDATAGSRRQEAILGALAERYPGGGVLPAPVAARRSAGGGVRWTGPAEVLAGAEGRLDADAGAGLDVLAGGGGRLDVLAGHAVRRLVRRGGRVVEAEAVALDSGRTTRVEAGAFVVAAGGIRTPALLWASGIGRDEGERSPLGRHLLDHPLAYAQVVLDPQLVPPGGLGGDPAAEPAPAGGPEAEPAPADAPAGGPGPEPAPTDDPDPFVVIPATRERPIHSVVLRDAYDARVLEGRVDDRLLLGLYWYTSMEPRFENRIAFGGGATDAIGLPQPTFEHSLTQAERERARAALDDLRAAGELLGTFLPSSPPQILSPGSSMHVMGTTRMGEPGEGVVDGAGQVWGVENLFLAGTGLIPCATASNPTLTACALAVATADRISRR
jgi:pyranose oxidase